MAALKDVKCIQITIWLGNTQEFQVVADPRYLSNNSPRDPCMDEMNFSKKGAIETDQSLKLCKQLLTDLGKALKDGETSLSISVEGNEIVPK